MTDYAYHQRGCIAYVVELWDIFQQLGIERKKPFVDHYTHLDRKDFLALARWDREREPGPHLPAVAQGDAPAAGRSGSRRARPRASGISNPPYEKLGEVCATQSAAFLRVAALVPRVTRGGGEAGEGRARTTRASSCASPTAATSPPTGCSSARKLPHSRAPAPHHAKARREARGARASRSCEIGHLDGWGSGPLRRHQHLRPVDARQRAREVRHPRRPGARAAQGEGGQLPGGVPDGRTSGSSDVRATQPEPNLTRINERASRRGLA